MNKEPSKGKGGRPPGATSKVKLALQELIQPDALKIYHELWKLARSTKDDAIKLGCYKEMLDREFGKPFQAIGVDTGPQHWVVSWSTDPVYDPLLIDAKPSDNS